MTKSEPQQMAKRGRRPRGEYPEKKRVFASRIREDTWKMLQQAAATSGRSISQEFEHRLRRGLDDDKAIEDAFGDRRTLAVMKMAAMAAVNSAMLNPIHSKVHWTSNVEAFDRALNAIVDTLKAFRPHELVAKGVEMRLEVAAPTVELVRQIQAADPRPLNKPSKRQRAMLRLKDELGDLVDRPGRLLELQKPKTEGKKKR
jgi:hypothetical protein